MCKDIFKGKNNGQVLKISIALKLNYLRWDNPVALNGRYEGGGGKILLIGLGDAIWDNWSDGLAACVGGAMGEISVGGGLKLWQSGCGVTVRNETSSPILRQFSLEFDGLLWLP